MPSLHEQCKPGLAQKVAAPRPTAEINSSLQECRTSADLRPWYVSYPSILLQWTNMQTLFFKSHLSWIFFYNVLQKFSHFFCLFLKLTFLNFSVQVLKGACTEVSLAYMHSHWKRFNILQILVQEYKKDWKHALVLRGVWGGGKITSPWFSKFCLCERDQVQLFFRYPAVASARISRYSYRLAMNGYRRLPDNFYN